jgi:hypothetical protein
MIIWNCSVCQVGSATSYSERPALNLYQERGYPEVFQSYVQLRYASAEDSTSYGDAATAFHVLVS